MLTIGWELYQTILAILLVVLVIALFIIRKKQSEQ